MALKINFAIPDISDVLIDRSTGYMTEYWYRYFELHEQQTANVVGQTLEPIADGTFVGNFSGAEAVPSTVTILAGANITLTPGTGTLTIAASAGYTDEQVRDVIGTALVAGTGIGIVVSDVGDTITLSSTVTQYTDEMARDAIGAALVAGAGITVTPNDGADTITVASSITQYTDEMVRDVMGAALVAGANITITVNDAGDTITIASSAGSGGLADGDYGDVTVSSSGTVITIDADVVTFAKMLNATAASKLVGRGSASGGGDFQEISLGSGLSMSGTTLDSAITQYTDEMARDALGTALAAGTGVTITVNDGADTITIATTITQYTDEMARDAIGTALVAGTGVSISVNDAGDTITISTTARTTTCGITIDGGGSVITTGIKGDLHIPTACTIAVATLLADQSGSIVIDIWKDTYANYPPTVADTITASAKPTLSAATKSQDSTLTGWTTSCSAGDVLRFNVDSVSTVTRVQLQLTVTVP